MNYYKITHKTETHNGLKYKTGLNVDPQPFNPHGDCNEGGIYFAKEDIFAFLSYSCWIREVTLPPDARVIEEQGTPRKWKADKVLLGERKEITAKVVRELLAEGADPKVDDSRALWWAAVRGHADCVELLIPVSDPTAGGSCALHSAAHNGHADCVELLIPVCDPKAGGSYALWCAAVHGHTDCVELLIPVSDPKDFGSALSRAAWSGQTDCVKLLEEAIQEVR